MVVEKLIFSIVDDDVSGENQEMLLFWWSAVRMDVVLLLYLISVWRSSIVMSEIEMLQCDSR